MFRHVGATREKLIFFLVGQNHNQFKVNCILFIQNRVDAVAAPYISAKVDRTRQRHSVSDHRVSQIWV